MNGILSLPILDASGFHGEVSEGVRLFMVDYRAPGSDADDETALKSIEERASRDGLVPFKIGAIESEQSFGRVRTIVALAK